MEQNNPIRTLGDYIKQKEKSYQSFEEASLEAWKEYSKNAWPFVSDGQDAAEKAWHAGVQWGIERASQDNPLKNYHGT